MSMLIFIIVLSILIIVHELGHFFVAKLLNVKVERFALGFGPKLISKKFRGTDFSLCAIPLGGYVKMAGDERQEHTGNPDEFYSHPPGHRALIILFGPIINYVLAFFCFYFVFITGYPTLSTTIGELINNYPAQAADLKAGDEIIAIDLNEMQTWDDLQKYISHSKGRPLNFTIDRDGKEITKTIVPKVEVLKNVFGQEEQVSLVGIKPDEKVIFMKYGFVQSFGKASQKLAEVIGLTYKALYRIATGGMSAKESVTGPIGIFYVIQKAARMGFSYLLYIMAVISASLAIFNLLPLPVLDGGHLALLGIEKIRGRALPSNVDEIINRVGLSFIIFLAIFVFYSDFVRYGLLEKAKNIWQGLGF